MNRLVLCLLLLGSFYSNLLQAEGHPAPDLLLGNFSTENVTVDKNQEAIKLAEAAVSFSRDYLLSQGGFKLDGDNTAEVQTKKLIYLAIEFSRMKTLEDVSELLKERDAAIFKSKYVNEMILSSGLEEEEKKVFLLEDSLQNKIILKIENIVSIKIEIFKKAVLLIGKTFGVDLKIKSEP